MFFFSDYGHLSRTKVLLYLWQLHHTEETKISAGCLSFKKSTSTTTPSGSCDDVPVITEEKVSFMSLFVDPVFDFADVRASARSFRAALDAYVVTPVAVNREHHPV